MHNSHVVDDNHSEVSLNAQDVTNPDKPPWGLLVAGLLLLLSYYATWLGAHAIIFSLGIAHIKAGSFFKSIYPLLALLLGHFLVFISIWLLLRARYGLRLKSLGWYWPENLRMKTYKAPEDYYSPRRIGLLLAFTCAALSKWPIVLIPGPSTRFGDDMFKSSTTEAGYLLLAILTAPLIEELVYRGICYPAVLKFFNRVAFLQQKIFKGFAKTDGLLASTALSIMVIALLFTLAHINQYSSSAGRNWGQIIGVFISGICFTSLRAYTKSLLPCFVSHTIANATNLIPYTIMKLGILPREVFNI
jgi:membrane protease YdiL (CAAX protease family)